MFRRRILGLFTRFLYPFCGGCGRCWVSWKVVDHYSVKYTTTSGEPQGTYIFCVLCKEELSPDERLPYYRRLYIRWMKMYDGYSRVHDGPEVSWDVLKDAVLKGTDWKDK